MEDVFSYALSDALLFSPRVYFRLFALRNGAFWPGHVLIVLAGLVLLVASVRPQQKLVAGALIICGLAWLSLAWLFFWIDYAAINWAAVYFAPLATLQGVLLVATAVHHWARNTGPDRGPRLASSALVLVALVGYPLLAPLSGRAWQSAEVLALAPDPTGIATLGVLAIGGIAHRWLLMIVPLIWCAITGLTLYAMGEPVFWLAPSCGLLAVLAILLWRREPQRQA